METCKRNTLKAKVKSITNGNDDSEVVIELDNGVEMTSITTKELANKMKLAPGKEVYAVIIASNIALAPTDT